MDVLKRFDAYPKISLDDRDFRNKTVLGAMITVCSTLLMLMLIAGEVMLYWHPHITEDLFVDTTRSHKLTINLDLFIPKISCSYLSLDAMDSAGDQHLHIEHNIFKQRFDATGQPIDEATRENITTTVRKETADGQTATTVAAAASRTERLCDCYGAAQNSTHCCSSCQDIIDAYRAKRWNPDTGKFQQCIDEGLTSAHADDKLALKEGCRIYGLLEVNRMAGSFHVAPGKSFSLNNIHIHDVHPFASSVFNTTHHIRHLSFGQSIDGANTHPLDGTVHEAIDGPAMYQYYIKIVPTMYVMLNGQTINTNQFSVTRHVKSAGSGSHDAGMPGVFFSYELSPLMVKYTESQRSLGHLLSVICAIIGGIFTVAGMLDAMFYKTLHAIRKKIELGKFS